MQSRCAIPLHGKTYRPFRYLCLAHLHDPHRAARSDVAHAPLTDKVPKKGQERYVKRKSYDAWPWQMRARNEYSIFAASGERTVPRSCAS